MLDSLVIPRPAPFLRPSIDARQAAPWGGLNPPENRWLVREMNARAKDALRDCFAPPRSFVFPIDSTRPSLNGKSISTVPPITRIHRSPLPNFVSVVLFASVVATSFHGRLMLESNHVPVISSGISSGGHLQPSSFRPVVTSSRRLASSFIEQHVALDSSTLSDTGRMTAVRHEADNSWFPRVELRRRRCFLALQSLPASHCLFAHDACQLPPVWRPNLVR